MTTGGQRSFILILVVLWGFLNQAHATKQADRIIAACVEVQK